jgi:hypothetical protein
MILGGRGRIIRLQDGPPTDRTLLVEFVHCRCSKTQDSESAMGA